MKLFEQRKLLKKISRFLVTRTLFSACELNMEIDFLDQSFLAAVFVGITIRLTVTTCRFLASFDCS